jgi:hypothetical protein
MTEKPDKMEIRREALAHLRRFSMFDVHHEMLDLFELTMETDCVWHGPDYHDTPYPSRGDLGGQEAVAWGVRKTRAWIDKVAAHAQRGIDASVLSPVARGAIYLAIDGVDYSSSSRDYEDGCRYNHEYIVAGTLCVYQLLLEEKHPPEQAMELANKILLGDAPSIDWHPLQAENVSDVAGIMPLATSFAVHQKIHSAASELCVPWWYRACVGRAEYERTYDTAQFGAVEGVGIFSYNREPCLRVGPGEMCPMSRFIDAALAGRELSQEEAGDLNPVARRWANAAARVLIADVDPSVDADPLIEAFLDEWDVPIRG